jgi:hypothetical protein
MFRFISSHFILFYINRAIQTQTKKKVTGRGQKWKVFDTNSISKK